MAQRVLVSRDYKDAYEAVRTIIQKGALQNPAYRVLDNGHIYDGVYEYVLGAQEEKSRQESTNGFAGDGASWFRCLRGEQEQSDDATWCNFMVNVKEEYHKRFSVVVYEQMPRSGEEWKKTEEKAQRILRRFLSVFCAELTGDFGMIDVRSVRAADVTEDIYGVSMHVELSTSATSGAPLPLLCKVYFNRNGQPIPWKTAKQYDAEIARIIPAGNEGDRILNDGADAKSDPLIDTSLGAVEAMVHDPATNLADYTWMGEIDMPTTDAEAESADRADESDAGLTSAERKQRQALRKLYIQMSHNDFALECQRVEVLYISHIKTQPYVCRVAIGGRPILQAEIGINDTLTVQCLNCDDRTVLVDHNTICYREGDVEKTAVINAAGERMGLTDDVIAQILQNSPLHDHLLRVRCDGYRCYRVRCRSQVFDDPSGDSFCMDCTHPEIVYTDLDGKPYYTPAVTVTTDTLQVYNEQQGGAAAGEWGVCAKCHRAFSRGHLVEVDHVLLCKDLCAPAERNLDPADARRCYRTYSGILPLSKRLLATRKRKACYEDEEMILFVLDNKQYLFNKLNVGEGAYLAQPQRIK